MNIARTFLFGAATLLSALSLAHSQTFDSGSDGSYGPINITADTTLEMPPDGIFHCTTIFVDYGTTLRFNPNALNTPVYLLATNDVIIYGRIDVSGYNAAGTVGGQGGPGGFAGGYGGFVVGSVNLQGGDGQGPGGGRRLPDYTEVRASFAAIYPALPSAPPYGNALLYPLIGGSGASGQSSDGTQLGLGGGGGGGAILIASDTRILLGKPNSEGRQSWIFSRGGSGSGEGTGGAIRLVAPIVTTSARSSCILNTGGSGDGTGRSGRVRIDCLDNYAYRSIQVEQAVSSRGSQMFVFPPKPPRLDILEAAGKAIPDGGGAVSVELPPTADTNQIVKLQARDFSGTIPVTVAVTPENGPSTQYTTNLDMTLGNPAVASIPVVVPAGTISRILAWATK